MIDQRSHEITMNSNSTPRRTQFSSCDACRQARVACDASKHGYQPGRSQWTGSCSRCSTRNKQCTFNWIGDMKKSSSSLSKSRFSPTKKNSFIVWELPNKASTQAGTEASTRMGTQTSTGGTDHSRTIHEPLVVESDPNSSSPSPSAEFRDSLPVEWFDQIFHQAFSTIFGLWVGRNGCPLINNPTSNHSISPTDLFCDLDTFRDEQLADERPSQTCETSRGRSDEDFQINQSLRLATQSFVARWLPNVIQKEAIDIGQLDFIIRESWRATRRDMLRVINRVSYRSVLALYLFSQTPIPVGISEDEELNGLTGVVCTQAALLQIQQLRGRLRSCHLNGAEVSAWSIAAHQVLSPELMPAYVDLESRAYWAAVTWDTSNSVTSNFRSTLSTGLRGACLEPAWVLARGFLLESFHPKTEIWRKKGYEITNENALEIIPAAGIGQLYVWRTIASLKEALREGVDEESVQFAFRALLDGLEVFKTTIRPLLDKCERRLQSLSQVNRLNWYEITLHLHLGILILVDAVETAHRSDLLSHLEETRLDAEHQTFNILKFGIESTYSFYMPQEQPEPVSGFDHHTYGPEQPSINTSFVAIDPYPHLVVASVQLIEKAISRNFDEGKIEYETYADLSSTLTKVLEQLPQNSKFVCSARKQLERSLQDLRVT